AACSVYLAERCSRVAVDHPDGLSVRVDLFDEAAILDAACPAAAARIDDLDDGAAFIIVVLPLRAVGIDGASVAFIGMVFEPDVEESVLAVGARASPGGVVFEEEAVSAPVSVADQAAPGVVVVRGPVAAGISPCGEAAPVIVAIGRQRLPLP